MQVFSRISAFKKAVILSHSTAAIQAIENVDAPPSKRVTEIYLSVKQLTSIQNRHKIPTGPTPLWSCGQ
jgi:hypothetical protein